MLFGDAGPESISARLISDVFLDTLRRFPNVDCPKYVIMPNHLHAIIVIERDRFEGDFRADMESAPTIPRIIQAFKRRSTIEYIKLVNQGVLPPFYKQIWQRSYYDHIIRSDHEYRKIWQYIDENPQKWRENPGEIEHPSECGICNTE